MAIAVLKPFGVDHYSLSARTGSMAAGLAADSPIFYCRWTGTVNVAVINRLEIDGVIATTAFAAGQILLRSTIARAFTAENGTPGGTALTLTTNNGKLRTSMATTGMTVVRIASTATLAAPTWTLDAQDLGQINTHSSGGVGAATPIIGSIYLPKLSLLDNTPGGHPLVLAENEGVVIRASVPATGVWIAGISLGWSEVPQY